MTTRNSDGVPPLHHIFHGEVANVQTYGAFVKIPGCKKQGLVHKSQMSTVRVDDPAEMVAKGEMVYCKIIGMEGEGEKISLSMKVVNQTTGRDLDPNNVQLSQDEKKRREWKHIGRDKIELGAELNTTCRKCGGHGHLAIDCFMAKADKVYELIPDLDTLTQLPSPDETTSSKAHKKKKKKKDKKSKSGKKTSSQRRTRSSSRDESESDKDTSDNDRRDTMHSRDQLQPKGGERQRKHDFSKDGHHSMSPSRKRDRRDQMQRKRSWSSSRDGGKERKNYLHGDRKNGESDDSERDGRRDQKRHRKRERSRGSSSSSSSSKGDRVKVSRGGVRGHSSSGSDAEYGTHRHTEQDRNTRRKLRRSESEDSNDERHLKKREKKRKVYEDKGRRSRRRSSESSGSDGESMDKGRAWGSVEDRNRRRERVVDDSKTTNSKGGGGRSYNDRRSHEGKEKKRSMEEHRGRGMEGGDASEKKRVVRDDHDDMKRRDKHEKRQRDRSSSSDEDRRRRRR